MHTTGRPAAVRRPVDPGRVLAVAALVAMAAIVASVQTTPTRRECPRRRRACVAEIGAVMKMQPIRLLGTLLTGAALVILFAGRASAAPPKHIVWAERLVDTVTPAANE